MAVFNATAGTDNFVGGVVGDTIVVGNTTEIQSDDVFNGAGGTDIIQIGSNLGGVETSFPSWEQQPTAHTASSTSRGYRFRTRRARRQ